MQLKNYYITLGLTRMASEDDIKDAFRNLALTWHPDRQPSHMKLLAHRKFIEISEAYHILADKARRREYNVLYDQCFGNNFAHRAKTYRAYEKDIFAAARDARRHAAHYMGEHFDAFRKELERILNPVAEKGRAIARDLGGPFIGVAARIGVYGIVIGTVLFLAGIASVFFSPLFLSPVSYIIVFILLVYVSPKVSSVIIHHLFGETDMDDDEDEYTTGHRVG